MEVGNNKQSRRNDFLKVDSRDEDPGYQKNEENKHLVGKDGNWRKGEHVGQEMWGI